MTIASGRAPAARTPKPSSTWTAQRTFAAAWTGSRPRRCLHDGVRASVLHANVPDIVSLEGWILSSSPDLPVKLSLRRLGRDGGDFGMVTSQPIKKGQKLVNIPRRLWMTSETAQESPWCRHFIEVGKLDTWKALCLHVLCERRLGSASYWTSYIDALPNQRKHPLLWNKEQQAWLKGSPMAAKLTARVEQVFRDLQTLIDVGANDIQFPHVPNGSSLDRPLVTEESVKWAAATLLSRAFNLETSCSLPMNGSGNGSTPKTKILALVPWADSLNHCSTATERSVLQYDVGSNSAVLFAHRDYEPGEEVFHSYGTYLTPSELLLDYGFVDEKNRRDVIIVPAKSILRKTKGVNEELMGAINRAFDGSPEMRLTKSGIDDTLLSYIRCSVAPREHLEDAGWVVDSSRKQPDHAGALALQTLANMKQPQDFNVEAEVLETLNAWCDAQLAGYCCSVQNDLEELEEEQTTWLRKQALRALVSEKRTVMGLHKRIRRIMQALKEGCPLETLYDDDEATE